MVLENQFLYLRKYLPTLSIDERIAYCKDLGDIFEEIVSDPNVLFDERDYSLYKTVTIGNQCWMAENLRYDIEDSWLNPKNPSIEYGRLYNWDAAMKAAPQCVARRLGPKGWHLPTDKEWTNLQNSIGGTTVGTAMKSTSGWTGANGTNASGFNAFPAGYYDSGSFSYLGGLTDFWSSTEFSSTTAWDRYLYDGSTRVNRGGSYYKTNGLSCRCIKNI